MGTQVANGHTGTEHMTAARWQAVFKSLWGADNVVFKTGSELAITITPGTGTVTVADGVFSFNGILGIVETSDSATYVKPASEGAYAKIGVAIKYTKNSETLVEALDVVCLKSTETTSVELAQALTIDYGDDTIDGATTEAHYPLYEFIVNSIADSNTETLFETVDTLPTLAEDLATAESDLTTAQSNIDILTPVKIEDATIGGGVLVSLTSAQAADYDYLIFIVRYIGQIKISKETFFTSAATGKKIYLGGYNEPYLEVDSTNLPTSVTLRCPSTGDISQKFYVYGVNTQ